jgi:hypothetical protein
MLGTPTNVWQIARCIYVTIRLGRTFDTRRAFLCRLPGVAPSFETYGRKILREEYNGYSDRLRAMLLRCLARDPLQRPTPRELLRECQEALNSLKPDLPVFPGIPLAPIGDVRPQDGVGVFGGFSSDERLATVTSSSSDADADEDEPGPARDKKGFRRNIPKDPVWDPMDVGNSGPSK